MKSLFFPNRVFWRLDLATGLSCKFKPRANGLASLGLLSCSATAGTMLQLLACLARVHHSGGLQPRATREIQPRVPVSLHNLEQFFTLSHTLPLHDSHLNTGLLIAKIQVNLTRNKAKKMVDNIQPYSFFYFLIFNDKNHAHFLINVLTRGESPSPRQVKQSATEGSQQLVIRTIHVFKCPPITLPPKTPHQA